MTKAQIPDLKAFYRLPFEEGSFELTEKTLNLNSSFQKPDYPFPIVVRNIHFRHEILSLGVKIEDEPEQLVFLKVTQHSLLVSCDAGTDPSFLSRHACFGLYSLIGYSTGKCFKKYFWPDFFDPQTGRSQILKIHNDRKGLDVEIKPGYPHFYRPGDRLIEWHTEPKKAERTLPCRVLTDESPSSGAALGYFLADVKLSSIHSNHYPFLVPFIGIPTKDQKRIKSYTSILLSENDIGDTACTPIQRHLNGICFRMRELAPVGPRYWSEPFRPNADEKEQGSQLLDLWHEAEQFILSQRHVHYYYSHGFKFVFGKPIRHWVYPCSIQKERPKLVLKRLDKGAYYQLELRFRINQKNHIPAEQVIAFFVGASTDPEKLYLLDRFADYQLISFFSQYGFKLAVLKCHYKDEIRDFVDDLAERYSLLEQ